MEFVPNWRTTARALSLSGPGSLPFMVQIQSLRYRPSNEGSLCRMAKTATVTRAHTLRRMSVMRMQRRSCMTTLLAVYERNRGFYRPEVKRREFPPLAAGGEFVGLP